jgi:hypothetical protein
MRYVPAAPAARPDAGTRLMPTKIRTDVTHLRLQALGIPQLGDICVDLEITTPRSAQLCQSCCFRGPNSRNNGQVARILNHARGRER